MAPPDEAADDNARRKAGKKEYMLETKQCLLFARDKLPGDVYKVFVKTMTNIWKQCADPDGEIRSICTETCIETAMKLFQGCAPVKQGFLNFTQGRSPLDGDASAHIQSPLDLFRKVKECPDISRHDYDALLQALKIYSRKWRTMTPEDVLPNVEGCMRNSPELLEEFKNYYLPDLMGLLTDEKSCRNLKSGHVDKATIRFTPDANQSLDGTQLTATNTRKEGSEESLLAKEDVEDKVEPLPDWITSRAEENLPPDVNPENFKRCTPSYYQLPHNCITLQSSYQTKLGRSVLNDALVSPPSVGSLQKNQSDYEKNVIKCEDQMFESDVLLERFRATADFIKNLQDRVGSGLRINEHLTPLHRRCIEKLYSDDPELYDVLETQTTSAALSILLSRLNQRVKNLSKARVCLRKILPPVIAENYYRSLDHHGPSFKQLDAKRTGQKALLAEAKEIKRMRLNAADEYANPDVHKDISSIISSACFSEENQMITWTKIVHPFLSAQCLWPSSEETVAPEKACEHCGTNQDFLDLPAELPLSSKRGESPKKNSNECSCSHDGFGVDIEEGEFVPDTNAIKSDVMAGPSGGDELRSRHLSTDNSGPSTTDHRNEPENQHESREQSRRTAKPRGVRGGTCCSLVVLCRLYQILYDRLQTARGLCTNDLYTEFREKLIKLLDRSIDNYKFEDFCLKFLGPKSFVLFTLDIVINRVIKQICIISSSDQDNSLVMFLQNLRRPILPKILSQHQNLPNNPSDGLPKHDREERDKALSDTGKHKLRHFERRKKRKME